MNEPREIPQTACCGNCCYWLETPSGVKGKGDNAPIRNGICRRFPPQMVMLGMSQSAIVKAGMPGGVQPLVQPMFPAMTEFGWCGEHPLSQAARTVISMTPSEFANQQIAEQMKRETA